MANNLNTPWARLTQQEKAELIGIYTKYGYNNLSKIIDSYNEFANGGKIHIKESKRGTFTAAAKSRGMGVQEFASKVLANKDQYSPAMVKKANFARNASKWHADGGPLDLLRKALAKNYDTDTFSEAFAAARNDDRDYFKWKGNRYNTKLDTESFLIAIRDAYNSYADGGPIYTSTAEVPPTIVTPDKDYNVFLNSLPDNQKYTPEEDYSTKRYWELHDKPKDFEEAKKLGMYTYDSSDNSYHANSVAWGKDGIGYFMKPKHHDTLKYELDWYNRGLITEEGGKQHKVKGKDKKEWRNFRDNYILDTSGDFYRYLPKKQ